MRVEVLDAAAIGGRGATIIREGIESSGIRVLGVATGGSPGPIYAALAASPPRGVGRVRVFALDEYVGIGSSHPRSYHAAVRREITEPLGLDPASVRVLDGETTDAGAECAAFEAEIAAAGGVDLQILGIGSNGHIAFNEPGADPSSRTRRARLDETTRRDNARFFHSLDDVPTHCLTQGIGTILEARRILLVARGAAKAHAIRQAIEGPRSRALPASWLLDHPDVTVLLDAEAASALTR
jgi:glucosamine-6-phosphate deaminase